MYKEAFEKTGIVYWFYKEHSNNEIKIMLDEDFKNFKSNNKKLFAKGKIEFSRIDEFRLSEGTTVLEDS